MNHITVKSVLNKTKRRDPWFLDDYTINPYSGCSFNCLYCYIRGSKYGTQLEMKLAVKENALPVLEKQLAARAKKNQYGVIVLASATDPYLQVEKDTELTRRILEIILKYRFPVHLITKSDLVLRDLDLIQEIERVAISPPDLTLPAGKRSFISFSFSTIDDDVAKIFEPGATPPSKRLVALRETVTAGVHAGVSLMPLLPFISDTRDALDKMYQTFADIGVKYVFPASMTLFGSAPSDSRTLMFRAIEKHFPELLSKYQELFANGFQTSYAYRGSLNKKTKALTEKYGLTASLL